MQPSNMTSVMESLLAAPSDLHHFVQHHSMPPMDQVLMITWDTARPWLAYLTWWKILLVVFAAANYRYIPFVYHLRILNAIRFVCKSQRPRVEIKPEQLFQPLITSARTCLLDIDVFGHKSNSTYFIDLDIARVHLITTILGGGIAKYRGSSTMNGLSGKKTSKFSMALGAVSCVFRKELRPYEEYDLWTRILAWDNKWFYMVTHFVKKGSQIEPQLYTLYPHQQTSSRRPSAEGKPDGSQSSPIAASGLSRIVFKDGRKTVTPHDLLKLCGLVPEDPALLESMETERLRGMKMAENLAKQSELDQEFECTAALGRHHDGMGVAGVVATLAQLGGLSTYQVV